MSSDSPEAIQNDIEKTRENLRDNVDALQEKVSIKGAASRSADRMKDSAAQMKENVMGTADSSVSSAKDGVGQVAGAVGNVPSRARRTTQGNPLAVGLGAFAVGWLVGSLIPATQKEQDAVQKVNESTDLAAPLQDSAQHVLSHAQETGKQAAQEMGQQIKSGAEQVKETAQP